MANAFYVSNAAAQDMLDAFTAALDAGTAAVINIYDGAVPADADAAEANNLLAQLTCSTTSFGAATDANPGALITANTISSDTNANSTGTATHFRLLTQDSGTVCAQGTAGVGGTYDLALNTDAITS